MKRTRREGHGEGSGPRTVHSSHGKNKGGAVFTSFGSASGARIPSPQLTGRREEALHGSKVETERPIFSHLTAHAPVPATKSAHARA